MEVAVKFVGVLRSASGRSKLTFNLKDAIRVRGVVEIIIKELPELERLLIDPELGDAELNTLTLLNGREISVLNGLETVLKGGDEIVFIPVSHGG